jgi:hypothetical protein
VCVCAQMASAVRKAAAAHTRTRHAGQGPVAALPAVAEEEVEEVRDLPAHVAGDVDGGNERAEEGGKEAWGQALQEGDMGRAGDTPDTRGGVGPVVLDEEGVEEGEHGAEAGRVLWWWGWIGGLW